MSNRQAPPPKIRIMRAILQTVLSKVNRGKHAVHAHAKEELRSVSHSYFFPLTE